MNCLRDFEVPVDYRELHIRTSYRPPNLGFRECITSVIAPTNETLNFWTHWLAFMYFTYKLIDWIEIPSHISDSYYIPFTIFIFSSCCYTLLSSGAHLFNARSASFRHLCFFSDYFGISIYGFGCALAYRAYSFPTGFFSEFSLPDFYLYIAFVLAIGCMVISSESRFMSRGFHQQMLRVIAFGSPFLFNSLPLFIRLASKEGDSNLMQHAFHLACAFLGCFFYCVHFPEKFVEPGKFDVVGQSHQLFHCVISFGTSVQLNAILVDLESGESGASLAQQSESLSREHSLGAIILLIVINSSVVLFFAYRLYRRPKLMRNRSWPSLHIKSERILRNLNPRQVFKNLQAISASKLNAKRK